MRQQSLGLYSVPIGAGRIFRLPKITKRRFHLLVIQRKLLASFFPDTVYMQYSTSEFLASP